MVGGLVGGAQTCPPQTVPGPASLRAGRPGGGGEDGGGGGGITSSAGQMKHLHFDCHVVDTRQNEVAQGVRAEEQRRAVAQTNTDATTGQKHGKHRKLNEQGDKARGRSSVRAKTCDEPPKNPQSFG